jgi:hypothetical protein
MLLGEVPLLHVRRAIAVTMVVAFLASVIIEAPFALLVLTRGARRQDSVRPSGRRLALGLIGPQIATYTLLLAWYGLASVTSALGVPVDQRIRADAPSAWVHFKDSSGAARRISVRAGDSEEARYPEAPADNRHPMQARLLDPGSPWKVRAGGWAGEGLRAVHASGKKVHVALETPSVSWYASHATLLPAGYVVLELGRQIVLLRLEEPALAFLAMGADPYVVLEP